MAIDWKGKLIKLIDFGSESVEIRKQRTIFMAIMGIVIVVLVIKFFWRK